MAKKGENIYKRKDNRWEGRYIKSYQVDGRPKYGYCYARTYREVKEKLERLKASMYYAALAELPERKIRLGLCCEEWLRGCRHRLKVSTYAKYLSVIENHIRPRMGGYFVQSITTEVVEQFTSQLLYSDGLSAKTVKDILMILRSVLKYAATRTSLRLPEVEIVNPKDVKREIRVLSLEEQETLCAYLLLNMDRSKFGIILALLTGLRVGELCALKWKDVDLKDRTIRVSNTMQRIRNVEYAKTSRTQIYIGQPKSETSARTIPLSDYAVRLCRRWKVASPEAYVLTGKVRAYLEPRMMQYKLDRCVKECGLQGVHFHTLRHTFATRCVEVGFEIKSLSEVLGHSNPRITLERYVHSSLALKKENIKKLADVGF